jgi:hypothetical protein
MPGFVPSGYLSIHEALNHFGRELFQSAWTGEEHKARRDLISEDEWLKIKDLPPPRGSDAPGSSGPRSTQAPAIKPATRWSGNPSDPLYQDEYRARNRYTAAQHRLRQLLETGQLEAAILDPWTGNLHRVSASLWRRHNADRMIEKGQAPIPRSRNTGSLLVKRFAETKVQQKPMPQAKMRDAIEAVKQKVAVEKLTRPQQKDFLRKTFPNYRLTERQFNEIFRAISVPKGRPRKSDKKV